MELSDFQIIFFSLLLLILIILGAFFSCAETGLMAANRYRLRHLARMKKRSAIHILQLLKRPDRLLGAILIGNTFSNMLASSLATLIAFHFWGDKGALLAAIILTFVVLILGEMAPKTLAAIYPEKVSRWVVYPIKFVLKLLYPLILLSNKISNTFLRILGVHVTGKVVEPLSREELRSVVHDTGGRISRRYQNMLLSILDLSKLKVDDVMIPRHEILGVNLDQSWEEIVKQINQFPHDWLPVYKENINSVVGVLYTRDILKLLLVQPVLNKELLMQLIQEPYFVPEGTPLNIQLGYFQNNQAKMAFVVDEYGEIIGLLTLHDILEEIVGDFTYGIETEKRIHEQTDGSYLVEGSVTVREFNRTTAFDLPSNGPRTLNGLIVEHLESLPHSGTAVLIAGYPIEIIKAKENRVRIAKVFPKLNQE